MAIPPIFRSATFETFDPSVSPAAATALEAAQKAATEGTNLVLIGRPGAGKTHLAAAICNAVRPRRPFAWCSVVELISMHREDARTSEASGARWAHELREDSGVVVLDDLGRERVSDWTGEIIYRLINRRYEHARQTIITSNLSTEQLAENGYGAVLSRLAERGELLNLASAIDYRTLRRPKP